MKTKDKTKESSQHSLCKITRVSLDSRTQYLVQNFPQTCTKVSLFNLLAHEHIYTGCWSNEMQNIYSSMLSTTDWMLFTMYLSSNIAQFG